jgi:2-keto-4-pentenoate hydratase/2-oxohepta-3-ene-1,7-dioic acid hydratase in catechol pathway
MRYLARSVTGDPLVGEESGVVPPEAAIPDAGSIQDALPRAADGLPDPGDAPASPVPANQVSFGSPIADPGKLPGIGLNYADHAADLDEERPDEPASFSPGPRASTPSSWPARASS